MRAEPWPVVDIQDAKSAEFGDYTTNIAMIAAKGFATNPRALGEAIAAEVAKIPGIARAEVAGPGFINIWLSPTEIVGRVQAILEQGDQFGHVANDQPQRINVEFVSVNPNGPITIGSGRGAAYGSALCNVLEAAGHTVHREYYINDGVNSEQMRLFAESVRSLVEGTEFPEGGYKGDYVQAVADHLKSGVDYRIESQNLMLAAQRKALTAFGTEFDTWFSEQGLHDAGMVEAEIEHLESSRVADDAPHRNKLKLAKGGKWEDVEIEAQVSDEDDADGTGRTLWLRSTKFGDDQDRVLRRRDGRLTYIASDVAYHKDKFNRPANADRLITILGPDHHGYIGRLRAVVAAMLVAEGLVPTVDSGEPLTELQAKIYKSTAERDTCASATALAEQKLEVQIFQLVRFLKDGKPAPMRKRDGNIYALIDLMREIGSHLKPDADESQQLETGSDVARFFYLMRSHDTTFDFDLDLAQRESDENPVFYVQYAHARICSVLAKAAEQGLQPDISTLGELNEPRELTLIKKVDDLPFEVLRASQDYGVHRLATYAQELAKSYHSFYDVCRVIQPENPALTGARLALCQATALGLRRCLALLGISAPERM